MTFSEMNLHPDLLRGIEALGFTTPTEIQQKVIPIALNAEFDLTALAQTGTGKTAAFGLPLLHNLKAENKTVQALVLCPTRELCIQVTSDLEAFSRFSQKTNVVAVYGGASIQKQMKELKAGAQVIVATPGRLIDLMRRNFINFEALRVVVMDEADEMLNMGFREDLEVILGNLPEDHATWLFSATMSNEIHAIAQNFMHEPTTIGQARANKPNENIKHGYFVCRSSERYEVLKRVLDANPGLFGLIFCQTKREVQELAETLIRDGYNSDALHGDLSQADRDRVMNRFRSGRLDVLIATDVAARGIDVDDITHVINYGFPYDLEAYTHRTGRTGRAGKTGTAYSIVTMKFERHIQRVEDKTQTHIERMEIPKQEDIVSAQIQRFLKRITAAKPDMSILQDAMPQMLEAVESMSKEELLMQLAARELSNLLAFYRGKEDIFDGGRKDKRKERIADGNTQRIFVNIGKMDGYSDAALISLIKDKLNLEKGIIKSVDMNKNFCHIEVQKDQAKRVMEGMNGITLDGRVIRANEADSLGQKSGKRKGRKPRNERYSDSYSDRSRPKKERRKKESKPEGKPWYSDVAKGDSKKVKKAEYEFF